MKKTLVALAVLAASGASFAQATLTGNYTFGYKQTQSVAAIAASGNAPAVPAGTAVSGFGTDTAAIALNASEDLGGGLKVAAKVSLASMMRDGAGTGEDAYVTLTGGFGTVKLGTVEAPNGLLAIGSSNASGFGLDGSVIGGSVNLDVVGYSTALTNALALGVSYTDETGLGFGTSGPAAAQSSVTAGVTYAAGPLTAKVDFTSYLRNGNTDITGTNTALSRYRLSAAYDMGAARVSGGYLRKSSSADTVNTEMLLGLAVPVGAVTLGLDYGSSAKDVAGTKSAEKSGYSLGASYALSKRTSVSASYLSWTTKGVDGTNTGFRTFVSHSF